MKINLLLMILAFPVLVHASPDGSLQNKVPKKMLKKWQAIVSQNSAATNAGAKIYVASRECDNLSIVFLQPCLPGYIESREAARDFVEGYESGGKELYKDGFRRLYVISSLNIAKYNLSKKRGITFVFFRRLTLKEKQESARLLQRAMSDDARP